VNVSRLFIHSHCCQLCSLFDQFCRMVQLIFPQKWV